MPVYGADPSAPNIQAGEKRGGIATHKYEGLTSCQRTTPLSRRGCGDAAAGGIILLWREALSAGMGQKEPNKELIFIDICRELAKSSSGTLSGAITKPRKTIPKVEGGNQR
jgi:hypothetical protein